MTAPYTPIDPKDPAETLDYGVDWVDWLPVGDTIESATVVVPTDLTVVPQLNQALATVVGSVVVFWLSGGQSGKTYSIRVTIVTAAGRHAVTTLSLLVQTKSA